eukprot:c1951_g1_i1.p1 GENE.c1951_g1_i1~~c1951_g1_i1.p1  ORF type:complete len:318 (+),score=54.06 c1951_g1_i1:34-987(+)
MLRVVGSQHQASIGWSAANNKLFSELLAFVLRHRDRSQHHLTDRFNIGVVNDIGCTSLVANLVMGIRADLRSVFGQNAPFSFAQGTLVGQPVTAEKLERAFAKFPSASNHNKVVLGLFAEKQGAAVCQATSLKQQLKAHVIDTSCWKDIDEAAANSVFSIAMQIGQPLLELEAPSMLVESINFLFQITDTLYQLQTFQPTGVLSRNQFFNDTAESLNQLLQKSSSKKSIVLCVPSEVVPKLNVAGLETEGNRLGIDLVLIRPSSNLSAKEEQGSFEFVLGPKAHQQQAVRSTLQIFLSSLQVLGSNSAQRFLNTISQ